LPDYEDVNDMGRFETRWLAAENLPRRCRCDNSRLATNNPARRRIMAMRSLV
jgi:hypothetical protein